MQTTKIDAIQFAVTATTARVTDEPGQLTTLLLLNDQGELAILPLGPADALALAADLLTSARRRFGRQS